MTNVVFLPKKSLGAHSECNVKKQVAYVLRLGHLKSIWLESGDNRFCVLAYLTALLEGGFSVLAYLTTLLEGRFSVFALGGLWGDFG